MTDPNGWRPIAEAPRDGTPFLALNHDNEVWVAAYDPHSRLMFRTNKLREPKRYTVHVVKGKRLLEEDQLYASENEEWCNDWTFWTRGYEFKPTLFMPLPAPPAQEEGK